MNYIEFEKQVKGIFLDSIKELGKDSGWSIYFNYKFYEFRHQRIEVDIVIKKEDRIFAIAEIKISDSFYAQALKVARQSAFLLQCPYFFIILPEKYEFFDIDGRLIKKDEKLITSKDIFKILKDDPYDQTYTEDKWQNSIKELIRFINEIDENCINKEKVRQAVEKLSDNKKVYDKDKHIEFNSSDEDIFFNALLPDYEEGLCRFTSFNSLFRTLNTKCHSMCSIIAMNDKSEISYVRDYLSDLGNFPGASYLSSPENWNQCFITSCCKIERYKDFTMMRLYGDNASGVVLKYEVNKTLLNKTLLNNGFILKSVSYQRDNGTHPELDIIQKLLDIKIAGYNVVLKTLSVWQHYFKPKEYAFEEEVRLLYRPNEDNKDKTNIMWILNSEFNIITPIISIPIDSENNLLPLIIKGITLGPKVIEQESNQKQVKYLLEINKIKGYENIDIDNSVIKHYR